MERQETVVTLDRLKVIILDHGEKVRQVELDDPRADFIEAFNEDGREFGLEAQVA